MFGIVLLVGSYLVTLGAVALLTPSRAARFLRGFAGSARVHYTELALRGVAGGSFIMHAPHMRFAAGFSLFGWVLLVTTIGLVAVPWRWHRAFALRGVPYATRHLALVGIASMVAGALVLAAALSGG